MNDSTIMLDIREGPRLNLPNNWLDQQTHNNKNKLHDKGNLT